VTSDPFEVILERRARRNLAALDPPVRRRVAACIDDLTAEPRPPGATELKGRPGVLRIRAGDYRILYEVRDKQLVVLVIDIGHRREIYR
jgi:mRNA interferase RelE/StbE